MKKLQSGDLKRVSVAAPDAWLKRIEEWRRQQPGFPTLSETIRRLVDLGLDAQKPEPYRPRRAAPAMSRTDITAAVKRAEKGRKS